MDGENPPCVVGDFLAQGHSDAANNSPPNAPDILSSREHDLLRHYTDPDSLGFRNATKAAELAGYKGRPGSPQLAVQGSRTLRRAREHGVLKQVLVQSGCTLEHAAERLAACLDARRRRLFLYQGEIIEGLPEDDFRHQLEAAKFVFGLHGFHSRYGDAHVVSISDSEAHVRESVSGECVPSEYKDALTRVQAMNPAERDSLREVLECDASLRDADVAGHPQASAQEAGDGAQGDPEEA